MTPDQQQTATDPAVAAHPAPAAGLPAVPYTGPGIPAVQQVVLPDGRVVTGYTLTPAAPPPAVPERRAGIDPTAQKMAAGGVLAIGVGVGGSLLFNAIAAAGTALGLLAACLVLVWAIRGRSGGGGGNVRVDVTVSPNVIATSNANQR